MTPAPAHPPRCIACDYPLEGLDDEGCCPECGRSYNLRYPSTYTTHPPFDPYLFWLPGSIQAAAAGSMLAVILTIKFGDWRTSLLLAIPFAIGSLLGYRFRSRWAIGPLITLTFAVVLIVGLASLSLKGIFYGFAIVGLVAGPIGLGMFMGFLLRAALKQTRFPQRGYLPVLLLALPPAFDLLHC